MKPSTVTIVPFLVVPDGAKAVAFYTAAFNATEDVRYDRPDGKLTSRINIVGAVFWIGDEEPEFQNLSPVTIGGTGVRIILTIADPDAAFQRALNAGAKQICPVTVEEHWKIGKLSDPFGHIWEIGHPLGDQDQ